MPEKQVRAIRRVVTGHDASGRSCVVEDGAARSVRTLDIRPGFQSVNIWRTSAAPSSVHEADSIHTHVGIAPPTGGTVLRIIDLPPEPSDPAQLRALIGATFGGLFTDAHRDSGAAQPKHPGMHRTATIDYALILEGEVFAVLDAEETLLKAGDVLIQRGINHAWANRSQSICRIAFILIDAVDVTFPPAGG
ncbi:MAG: hypothetical protein GAK30_03825 [Paracidovorax wautersii]|uniref:Cupin domain-containing protein n=1 Tax=Paracidovorax wautersii TaxID=1177982 RepID=A0A7V8FKI2_9BURK|nr:MAG: hypothetical protein GAK30_03825 [Paracidovorax wautersii]